MPRLLVALALALLTLPTAAHAAERRVPQGWLGVTVDGPVNPYKPGEWNRMTRSGVESVRIAVRWFQLQPYAPGAVPETERARFRDVGGVPTDFTPFDAYVAAAAARGLAVLPVVELAPSWLAIRPMDRASPPADPEAYGRFMAALVGRYGPDGSLWRERPELRKVPIRTWQIWNEPSLGGFWSEQPFAPTFVPLLRSAATAVRAADPGAKLVLAGLPNLSWEDLERLYAAGARGLFDAVAVHPYTRRPRDVVRVIQRARRVMRANGDAAVPIWVTEMSWPAAVGRAPTPTGFEVTDAGQAGRLATALRMLFKARGRLRIERVFWYTWLSRADGPSVFDWSGLRRVRDGRRVGTPALAVFRRAARRLQGCPKAPSDARSCAP